MSRIFKGIYLPASLYLNHSLTWTQKIMIAEIDSFSKNGLECFVSNEHLSEHLQISVSGVEKALRRIVELGYVERRKVWLRGANRRILRVVTSLECGTNPHQSEVKPLTGVSHTNTRTNTMNNPMKESKPNTLEDCSLFFDELGKLNEAVIFMDYYDSIGWKTKGGNKIKDWKATARNWARRSEKFNNGETKGFNKDNFSNSSIEHFVTQG